MILHPNQKKFSMGKRFIIWSLLILSGWSLGAQSQDDPILFTVNGDPVHVSEFTYIYTKTNGEKADFSEGSLEEYLRLYTKFKLKVQKAKEMQLDTIPSLQQELEGYRRQLADSYLIDKEVTDKLIAEAYKRQQQDVNISHIMAAVAPDAPPKDTMRAHRKIMKAKAELEAGQPWDSIAIKYSADRSVKRNYGHIGFVTALFPNGLYNLETAAYTLEENKLHGPLRTASGYHLMMVHDRRPARGEMEVKHILLRFPKEGDKSVTKARIDSLYQLLVDGQNFEALAKEYSEDTKTAAKGGYIGFFGINRYEKAFEDSAFALEKDEDFSKPIQTQAGWHILKRVSKKPLEEFSLAKTRLQGAIKRDARFELAKTTMINRIKEENNFIEFNTTLKQFQDSLDQEFLTYKWKPTLQKSKEPLFAFGKNYVVTLGDFNQFLGRSSRKRIRMGRSSTIEATLDALYQDFISESTLKFEEQQLDKKYPEFKSLMREYEEGILLFEATKMLVWDKAAQDTTGLKEYFKKVEGKYKWRSRAITSIYTINSVDPDLADRILKYAAKNTPEKVLAKFNTNEEAPVLAWSEKTVEEGRNMALKNIAWKEGTNTSVELNKREKTQSFMKIEKILPVTNKTLDEAKGYVIADYQDHLQRIWVEDLEKEYKIEVDRKVFESLIK